MILFPQPDLVSVAGVRHNELALRHPRESTFWQRIARRFEFENVPDGPHRVSAVWVPSGDLFLYNRDAGSKTGKARIYLRPRPRPQVSRRMPLQLQELRVGQLVEVLSLAGTQPTLYEPELQMSTEAR